ncbi:unnamed protein product [Effrenium voratum]|nr:unnamed protein product [Effrenium voratum]
MAKKHNLSVGTVKAALDEFRELGEGRKVLTPVEFEKGMRRKCGLAASAPIPRSLRAAALMQGGLFQGENHEVDFEEYLLWSQTTNFVEETLVKNPRERRLRFLAKEHGLDIMSVEYLLQAFNSFDADGSGFIESDEFRQVLCGMLKVREATDVSDARLMRYWREADPHNHGRLSFEEFLKWYGAMFPQGLTR